MDDYSFLEQQGVSERVRTALAQFRAHYPAPAELASRVPRNTMHYLGREVWEQAATALLCGQNVLLVGPKATGKNLLAEDLAYVMARPAWNVSFHVDMDASSLIGQDTYTAGQVVFRAGPVTRCAQAGGLGILDEVNMARSEALVVLHATLDWRRAIDVPGYDLIPLHEATRFVGTMNEGYAGTRPLNEALTSRFVVIRMPEASAESVEALLRTHFSELSAEGARQLARVFDEIRLKCAHGEISDAALDLRGLLDAVRLMQAGLEPLSALRNCLANKTFDPYERALVEDVLAARIPKTLRQGKLFE